MHDLPDSIAAAEREARGDVAGAILLLPCREASGLWRGLGVWVPVIRLLRGAGLIFVLTASPFGEGHWSGASMGPGDNGSACRLMSVFPALSV